MKLIWSPDHCHVISIAETPGEVVFCDIFTADLNAFKYMTRGVKGEPPVMARYMIKPNEGKE